MFGTSGIRGPVGETVTASLAVDVGRAVASEGADRVVVGRDPRDSGRALADALAAGLRECGADVVDLGLAATPTVARAVAWQDADAGVSVTASHNPPQDNGLKLWTPSGQAYDEPRREAVAGRIREEEYAFAGWNAFGDRGTWTGATDRHADAIVATVDPVADLSVVVDVGNGAGAVTAEALTRLGCEVETLNAQPDGSFPARPSEPTADNCTTLQEVVTATDADLGVAHDGDADRAMAVAEDGTFLGGDELLALFARDAVTAARDAGHGPDGPLRVAAPVNTSMAVDEALDAVDATVTRTRVGDVFVAERTTESDVVFGGEPSGAWIWPAETRCPDGPLAACRLAALVARDGPLGEQVAALPEYPIVRDSVDVPNDEKAAVMDRVSERVQADHDEVTTVDGVRAEAEDGWFLIRPSGTQPLVRITAQAGDRATTESLAERALAIVRREA
jgi:phosphoglucosamine mutase